MAACSNNKNPSSNYQPQAVENALKQAETVPLDSIGQIIQSLPGTMEQDSFTIHYMASTMASKGMPGITATIQVYERTKNHSPLARAYISLYKGLINQHNARSDSASYYYTQSAQCFAEIKDIPMQVDAFGANAGNLAIQGKYSAAIASCYQAIDILESYLQTNLQPDQRIQAEISLNTTKAFVANHFNQNLQYDKAIETVSPALDFFTSTKDTSRLTFCLSVRAVALEKKGDIEQALKIWLQSQALLRATKNRMQLADNLNNQAKLLQAQQKWQEALDTLQVSYKLYQEFGKKNALTKSTFNIACSEMHLNRLIDAEQKFKAVYDACENNHQWPLALSASLELSKIYQQQHNMPLALDYQKKAYQLRDSVFNQEKNKTFQELTFKHETREKEIQISNLQREKTLAQQRNTWIVLLSTVIMALAIGAIRIRNQKQRKILEQQIEAERLEKKALAAKESLQAQKIAYSERELALHQQQLQDFAQLLQSKNLQIADMKTKMSETGTPLEEEPVSLQSNEPDMEVLLRHSLFSDSDYEIFKIYFDRVYPGLIGKIKLTYPNLTEMETRVLLLMKMGLRDRQMGIMIGIESDSVKKLRYRLRKKMNLNENELIENLLSNASSDKESSTASS